MGRTVTCQICGRPIKANAGLIAHHGYRRPNPHHQTRGCFGARHQPYEEAHDALDLYIPALQDAYDREAARLQALIASPPGTLDRPLGEWGARVTYVRPDGFEPARHAERGSYNPSTYEGQFSARCSELRRRMSDITIDLGECRERRAAWRAP